MIFVLDNIRSKFNIGSIFRICDVFSINKLILAWYRRYPPDEEISKTAIWAEDYVEWEYAQEAAQLIWEYKKQWRSIISIELTDSSRDFRDYRLTWNEVFIFWNEIKGVSEKIISLSDEVLHIPINWKIKESLNVWISAWIIWSWAYEFKLNQ